MTVPTYLLEKLARHGSAAQRLVDELRCSTGEFGDMEQATAVAFDAADFVWAFLCLYGYDEAQTSREIRNAVAQAIAETIKNSAVYKNSHRA